MKLIRKLNESEIERIIAEYFNTDIANVTVKMRKETVGYGPGECEVPVVICEIETEEEF